MKVEVTLWDSFDEEIFSTMVDVGNDYDAEDDEDDDRGSEKIHDVIDNMLLFPGFHITITIPDDKERADYSALHDKGKVGAREKIAGE
jgi:hypothetical protein